MRRRSTLIWGALLAVLAVCAAAGAYLLFTRQGGGVLPAAQPAVHDVYTSRLAEAGAPWAEFGQSHVIYVHFTADSEPGTRKLVEAALIAVEAEGVEPETQIAATQGSFPAGPDYIQLSSSRPWPLGRYRIDLSADGAVLPPLEIAVAPTNSGGARLVSVYATTDQAGQNRVEVFPPTGSIYIQFELADAPDDSAVRGVLTARQASGLRADTQVTETNGRLGSGAYWFEFFNNGPWPVGDYTVYIYLNGQLAGQVDLKVQ